MNKTAVQNSFDLLDIKYELADSSEKENSSENEIDLEDKNITYKIKKISNTSNINQPLAYFISSQSFWNLNIDIHVPPPRV